MKTVHWEIQRLYDHNHWYECGMKLTERDARAFLKRSRESYPDEKFRLIKIERTIVDYA